MTCRRARWLVTAHLGVVYVLSTIPTPLYDLYRREFGFSQLMLTVIYAIPVIGVGILARLESLAVADVTFGLVIAAIALAAVAIEVALTRAGP